MNKYALSLLALVLTGAVQAATVPTSSYNIVPNTTPLNIYLSGPGATGFYELNFGSYGGLTTFTLADTTEDLKDVKYELFNDSASALNSIGLGSLVYSTTLWDVNSGSLPSFSQLLAASSQYVLKITLGSTTEFAKTTVSAVPLPGAALLFGSALFGAGLLRRRNKTQAGSAIVAI